MDRVRKSTIEGLTHELASHRWGEEEIDELVDPKMGVISSYQSLLDSLERLRQIDLGDTPPAECTMRIERRQ